ncbi:MAG: hypothetical protein D6813_10195 [Calditrichaeota bacterium]|nr:MAG: hypothetical protein D6813_10195 [Calditrichota bacterium]
MKTLRTLILVSLLTSFFLACTKDYSVQETILKLEDQRVSCDSLLVYLQSSKSEIRAQAVRAMGRLQDAACLSSVIAMLHDPDPTVRIEAAFAIGQIGSSSAEDSLIAYLPRETSKRVKRRILEALGKIGSEKSIPVFLEYFRNKDSKLRGEAALASARMALRNLKFQVLTDSLNHLMNDRSAEVRWRACYALMRIKDNINDHVLLKALNDPDARVRMFAVRALGELKKNYYLEALGQVLRKDKDWRVRVNAANALGNYPISLVANYYTVLEGNPHVRIAILRAIGNSAQQDTLRFQHNLREFNLAKGILEEILSSPEDSLQAAIPQKGAALVSYAKLLGKEAIPYLANFVRHENIRIKARTMEALGETQSPDAYPLLAQMYKSSPTLVKIAILGALPRIHDKRSIDIYLQALKEKDGVLVALAAQNLAQNALQNAIHAQAIIDAYNRLPRPIDIEVAQIIFQSLGKLKARQAIPLLEAALKIPDKVFSKAAARALTEITGKDYSDKIVPFTKSTLQYRYEDIANLSGARALIHTRYGRIVIRLFANDAPLTVLNFVRLAEKGFYDGLTFHRVVPNFVIQGGDPRGDSWGSPGYSIRSEFNLHPYLTGTVGMASAGKDTEGCQFFITHSPQPHLDGRYTVFGQVIAGQEVVDAIQEGDTMESVEIKK